MRFMLLAKATKASEQGIPPKPELMAAIGRFAEEMGKKGYVVDQGGLMPSSVASRVYASEGTLSVVDGPFTETKELVGGYVVVDVPSKEVAIDISKRFLQLHIDVYGNAYEGESEVRQMYEMPPQA